MVKATCMKRGEENIYMKQGKLSLYKTMKTLCCDERRVQWKMMCSNYFTRGFI